MTLEDRAAREVAELHQFFADWYSGDLADTAPQFGRLDRVLAPGFRLITPRGVAVTREQVVRRTREGHGSGPLSISTVIRSVRELGEQLVLVEYEEWQDRGGGASGRISTAILRESPGLPNDLAWVHVHETALP